MVCHPRILEASLNSAMRQVELELINNEQHQEMLTLTEQLELTYEEIYLLHTLSRNLQISRGPAELAHICLDRLRELVHCQGAIICMDEGEKQHWLTSGQPMLDESEARDLVKHFERPDWSRPVVKNNVQKSLLAPAFPKLQNFAIVLCLSGNSPIRVAHLYQHRAGARIRQRGSQSDELPRFHPGNPPPQPGLVPSARRTSAEFCSLAGVQPGRQRPLHPRAQRTGGTDRPLPGGRTWPAGRRTGNNLSLWPVA